MLKEVFHLCDHYMWIDEWSEFEARFIKILQKNGFDYYQLIHGMSKAELKKSNWENAKKHGLIETCDTCRKEYPITAVYMFVRSKKSKLPNVFWCKKCYDKLPEPKPATHTDRLTLKIPSAADRKRKRDYLKRKR